MAYKQLNFIFTGLDSGKSKIKALADWVPAGGLLSGLEMAVILLCPHSSYGRRARELPGISCVFMHACTLTESYLTLCDPMDCSPPGSSVHRILQARILE